MNLFGRDEPEDLDRKPLDVTQFPTIQTRPVVREVQRPPLDHVAAWMRSLRYEDMMQMATEVHGIRADDPVDTPEKMAKLLHAWAKATTEREYTDAG